MSTKKCNGCVGEKVAMITMSEANWERIEQRHAQQKKFLLVVAIIATTTLLISNLVWIFLGTKNNSKSYEKVEEIRYETSENSHQGK